MLSYGNCSYKHHKFHFQLERKILQMLWGASGVITSCTLSLDFVPAVNSNSFDPTVFIQSDCNITDSQLLLVHFIKIFYRTGNFSKFGGVFVLNLLKLKSIKLKNFGICISVSHFSDS